MRILLIGANGQLAQDLKAALQRHQVVGRTHEDLDICDGAAVTKQVLTLRPDCIINTAAYHRVDECEDQVERSFAVNAAGVRNLVSAANQVEAVLLHFSTDFVFGGSERTPRTETDVPCPQSIYAMSKLAGEQIIQQYAKKYFLIRTCGLYGKAGTSAKGGNFVETMLRLAHEQKPMRVVNDQILTPTSTKDLAEKLAPLLESGRYGLYHMTNTGECSWFQFAQEIFRLTALQIDLQPTTSASFGAKARRPAYSVLDNRAYRTAGFADFRPWQGALADYIDQRSRR